jgi:aspartyl protease family protein
VNPDGDRGKRPSPWEQPPAKSTRFGRRLLFLGGGLALLLLALFSVVPPELPSGSEVALVQGIIFCGFVLIGAAASRQSLRRITGQIGIWMVLILVCVALYGYRFELSGAARRVASELLPSRGQALDGESVAFARAADRQFWIDAQVDGVAIRFLVDTGASEVVLARADAAKLGFTFERLDFTRIFDTANGKTRGAIVRLDELRIGSLSFDRVTAYVSDGELHQSLLGMGFLERLSSVEIRHDTLTIRR